MVTATTLDTRATEPEYVRTLGDFRRHPHTGAPIVSHPSATVKPKGTKAELLAMCEAAGITVPTDPDTGKPPTNPELIRLIEANAAGPAATVQYGRPSSYGKHIENATNLIKWSERMTALGVARGVIDGIIDAHAIAGIDPDSVEGRDVLDRIARHAKTLAQADLAAERGTHTHATTEDDDTGRSWVDRMEAGETLGLPPEVQAALLDAWRRMLALAGFEILVTEGAMVDDGWRLAGTLDRIVRLTRDLAFRLYTGEIVTLKAGTVLVLDLKTGRLRTNRKGHPEYWHGYAVQVAAYAKGVPYDTDTDTRGVYPFDVCQEWAIIAHLDVLAALDGAAVCRLILVDLTAGREAGDLVTQAKAWERRRIFSIVNDMDDTLTVIVPVETPTPSTPTMPPVEAPEWPSSPSPSIPTPPESSDTSTPAPMAPTSPDGPTPAPAPSSPPPFVVPPWNESETSWTAPGTPSPTTTAPTLVAAPTDTTPCATTDTPRTGTECPPPTLTPPSSIGTTGPTTTTATPASTPSATPPTPTAPLSDPAALIGAAFPDTTRVDVDALNADTLDHLAHAITEWPQTVRVALANTWPSGDVLPTPGMVRAGTGTWTPENLPLLRALFTAAGAPFNVWTERTPDAEPRSVLVDAPPAYTGAEPVEAPTLAILVDQLRTSPEVATVNRWLAESYAADGVGWSPLKMPTVRCYEIARAALALADAMGATSDDVAVCLIVGAADLPDPTPARTAVGVLLGRLSPGQAQAVAIEADRFANGAYALHYASDGTPALSRTVTQS